MAKKKKKQSGHQKQKLAQSQNRNEFYRKLHYIIKSCCSEDVYHLIPKEILKIAYERRCLSVKVVAGKGQDISSSQMTEFSNTILGRFNVTQIEISTDNEKNLNEFLTTGITALRVCYRVNDVNFPQSDKVKKVLSEYTDESKFLSAVNKELYSILHLAGLIESRLDKNLYWLKHKVSNDNKSASGIRTFIEVYKEIPETTSVVINNISRPVTQVCWADAYEGLKQVSIKPSELNLENTADDTPMKVYIQSHALNRLYERLDVIPEFSLNYCAYLAFTDMKVFYNANNNILIEYRLPKRKVGYFIVDIVDGMIIIRTFLFLTNSGTPEGQLLEQNTGLKKLDKKYLAIDKLSTFMSEDIENNKEVRKIFEDAGCKSLIGISEIVEGLNLELSGKLVAEQMIKYLNINMPSNLEQSSIK